MTRTRRAPADHLLRRLVTRGRSGLRELGRGIATHFAQKFVDAAGVADAGSLDA